MKWEKTIRDAALSTLAAIAGLFVFMILALSLFFPATMMHITYDLGMDALSISYAKAAYKNTKDVYYIAFATETAIGVDKEKEIVICGEKLIKDNAFTAYCERRNEQLPEDVSTPYEQYVYAQVCVALYEMGKKTEAVDRAFTYTGNAFPRNNAVAAVTVYTLKYQDTTTLEIIKGKIEQIQVSDLSEADKLYYDEILVLIS